MESAIRFIVPSVVVYIMTVVGLGLAPDDLRRVARAPRVVVLATLAQSILLPVVAVALAVVLDPPLHLATGMIVVAACPPAAAANLFVDLAGWDTALSVALTAVGNLLAPLVIPLVLVGAFTVVMGEASVPSPPVLLMMGQIVATLILPLMAGMWVRHRWPDGTGRTLPTLRLMSLGGIILVAALVGAAGADVLRMDTEWLLALSFFFTITSLVVGYVAGVAIGQARDGALTLAVDFGIRNGGIAVFVAGTLLGSVESAVFVVGILLIQVPAVLLLVAVFRSNGASLVRGVR